MLKIDDPEFVKASGKSHHSIVRLNGRSDSRVTGTVLELTDSELAQADGYEPAGYTRIPVTLGSRQEAWVYADAR